MGKTSWELIENFSRVTADDSANTFDIETYDSGSGSWVKRLSIDSSSGKITISDGLTVDDTMKIDKAVTLDGTVTVNGSFSVDNTGTAEFKGAFKMDNTGTSTMSGGFHFDNSSQTQQFDGPVKFGNTVDLTAPLNQNMHLNTLTGKTGGSVYWAMQERGASVKELLMYFDSYESTSGTQTIAFPTTFSYTPEIEDPKTIPGLNAYTDKLTIDPGTSTKYIGFVRIWGF